MRFPYENGATGSRRLPNRQVPGGTGRPDAWLSDASCKWRRGP